MEVEKREFLYKQDKRNYFELVKNLNKLAEFYYVLGKIEEERETLINANSILDELFVDESFNDNLGIEDYEYSAHLLFALGMNYKKNKEYDDAVNLFVEAIEIYKTIHDEISDFDNNYVFVLKVLGELLNSIERYDDSIEKIELAIEIANTFDEKERDDCLSDLFYINEKNYIAKIDYDKTTLYDWKRRAINIRKCNFN